ncbi:luciferase-like domain-containing protein [Bisporella sp. PMI_857]|nr:luciferase-like domain-containing protein [Bisporella sp. PMI_857]
MASNWAASEQDLVQNGKTDDAYNGTKEDKPQILLNAFDMFTIGHLSPGQWKNQNPADKGAEKHKLSYWIELAKLLERGSFNALFLADTYGGYDTYGGNMDAGVKTAAQWPVLDPNIPISAMAAVTKNLAFGITASTSFEPPYLLARRFSTLDHVTDGRIGWNIVTGWKKTAFQAIGLDAPVEHDQRYAIADEYLQGSWADDAVVLDAENDTYANPEKVRTINHQGKHFKLSAKHIVNPSPQRTPFLFQAGTSDAGIDFASSHAEAIFLGGNSPSQVHKKVLKIRAAAAAKGRDPSSLKFFISICPIIGRTDDEAHEKLAELRKYASVVGGLVQLSGVTGIDISALPLDQEINASDSTEANRVRSHLENFTSGEGKKWTPRSVSEHVAIGGLAPLAIGSPETVADELERWVNEAGIIGFNLVHATCPGSLEDVVNLLIPELRRRGLYPEQENEKEDAWTTREKVYGRGQKRLREDHTGSRYKFDVYEEDTPYENKLKRKTPEDGLVERD